MAATRERQQGTLNNKNIDTGSGKAELRPWIQTISPDASPSAAPWRKKGRGLASVGPDPRDCFPPLLH